MQYSFRGIKYEAKTSKGKSSNENGWMGVEGLICILLTLSHPKTRERIQSAVLL